MEVSTATSTITAEEAAIRHTLNILYRPGDLIELRVPHTGLNLFYDDHDALARRAAAIEEAGTVAGIYVTLNPLIPRDWMQINSGRGAKRGATDNDVRERYWIPIDVDPVRGDGHDKEASNAAELQAAYDVFEAHVDYLKALGWSAAESLIIARSGNGVHGLWHVDLPAHDGGVVARVLAYLSEKFSTESAHVDTSVFNPSRIWKLYGTTARKGTATEERPHRKAEFLYLPKVAIDEVRRELIEQIGGTVPTVTTGPAAPAEVTDGELALLAESQRQNSARVQAFLDEYVRDAQGPKTSRDGDGEIWTFACRYQRDGHAVGRDGRAGTGFIIADALGGILAGCRGERCRGKGLLNLLDSVAPGWRAMPDLASLTDDQDICPALLEPSDEGAAPEDSGDRKCASPSQVRAAENIQPEFSDFGTDVEDIAIKPLPFIWRNRIAQVGITIFEGDPETRKSSLMLWLCAQLGAGVPWFDGAPNKPRKVLYISAEDPKSEVMMPRIKAYGLDLNRNVRLQGRKFKHTRNGKTEDVRFTLPQHLPLLRSWIAQWRPEVIILDPLDAFVSAKKVSANNSYEIREQVLSEIDDIAEAFKVAFVLLRHWGKDAKVTNAKHKGLGSVSITGDARAVYAGALHPEDDPDNDSVRSVVARTKNNLGRRSGSGSFSFKLAEVEVETTEPYIDDEGVERTTVPAPMVVDVESCNMTAAELAGGKSRGKEHRKAKDFLSVVLLSGKPVGANEIIAQGADCDLSPQTLRRAADALGVKRDGRGHNATWQLPEVNL